ncbi:MAG: DNA-processing protein DprA [Thermodesulfobacteriota bacterium]
MKRDKLKYWLALTRLKGVKKATVKMALERFGSASDIFSAYKENSIGFSIEFGEDFAGAIMDFSDFSGVLKEIDKLEEAGIRTLTITGDNYPARLLNNYDPPLILHAKGDLRLLESDAAAVAIVGTRKPSHYGLRMSESIARDLATLGVIIISGMARGCDSAAHRGTLSAGGKTIAVLGTGLDIIYPPENTKLYSEIAEKGLIVSEFPLGTPPRPQNFPIRNRIISGLSLGVLVVEAPLRSGAMMTARLALEGGRDVFAVPGEALKNKNSGTNKLIKDGAFLVAEASDVLDGLGLSGLAREAAIKSAQAAEEKNKGGGQAVLSGDGGKIAQALLDGPAHIDDIIEMTGLPAKTASSLLMELELRGLILQLPGKSFLLKE